MGAHAAYTYLSQQRQMTEAMQQSSALSIAALQKNIASFIEAYAVNEYGNLVATEIELRQHFAIVVRDYNMGKILSQEAYISGKIRDTRGAIIDFDPADSHQRQWLANSFYTVSAPIIATSGATLGSIAIYNTDQEMRQELCSIVIRNLIDTVIIALLLITLLFLAIHRLLVRPLTQLAVAIGQHDNDGIPSVPLPRFAYREIALLTDTMNTMIAVIRHSRESLRTEHDSLQQSLLLNRLIIENIPDLLWLKDQEGVYLLCNAYFEQFFGAKEADIIGKTDYDFVARELADFFRAHDRNAMQAGKATMNEEWITFVSDGRRALLETTKVPLADYDGKVAGVLGIGHDITERHVVHQRLLESNARETALNQSLPVGVLVYDNDLSAIVFANGSAARILEMPSEQLIGSDLRNASWRVVPEEGSRAGYSNHWITLRADKAQQHIVLGLAFADHLKWLSINTEPFQVNGALAGVIVSFMDISREREIIEELDMERKRFQLAIEGSQDGLWDWNPNTDQVFYSSQWKRMLGYDANEISDTFMEWHSRVHPDDLDVALTAIRAHLRGETAVYENRHRLRCKDGNWKWVLGRGKALFDKQCQPLRMVGFHTDITEEMRHREQLVHSAKHDPLTRLPNRFLLNELIQNLMQRCQHQQTLLALLFVDLDGFKAINDTYGHEAGDAVLVTIAQRMRNTIRREDIVARLGGDEFVIAINDMNNQDEITRLLQRLLYEISLPIQVPDSRESTLQVSASIGVSFYPQSDEIGPEALLRQADQAMYEAKTAGRNQYRLFNLATEAAYREHLQMMREFQQALEQNEFRLHYQPKIDMASGVVLGFEALLRWQHPSAGLCYPDRFLPLLHQEKMLMIGLGQWVFENAFAQLAQWVEAGYTFDLSINVGAHEFKSQHSYALLAALLKRYPQISPQTVELEILETNALEDTAEALQMIRACQQLGLRIALDDFGTGYSTLSYLKDLPVNTLKIDKSFVKEILHDSSSFSILEAAIGLAEAFRCDVVAEGVEDVESGVMLLRLGCHVAQGFVIARPMPAEEVIPWLQNYRPEPRWQQVSRLPHQERSLLHAIIEHSHWLRLLEQFCNEPSACTPPELNPAQCRFGLWLQGEARTLCCAAELASLNRLHDRLHALANALCQGDLAIDFSEISALHRQILRRLDNLAGS